MAFKVTIKKNSDGTITRSVNGANSDQASNITTSKGTTVQTEIESITPYTKVTQAQYDALKSAGTLAKNTNYIITDKPYSADDVLDLATIKSRGASGTLKASDVASASGVYELNQDIAKHIKYKDFEKTIDTLTSNTIVTWWSFESPSGYYPFIARVTSVYSGSTNIEAFCNILCTTVATPISHYPNTLSNVTFKYRVYYIRADVITQG